MSAVQVDAGGRQVDGADVGRRRAAGVEAGGIDAFAFIAVKVEFDGHAVGNAAGAADVVGTVTQAAAQLSQSRGRIALDDESHAVGRARARRDLEGELRAEARDVDGARGKEAAGFA